jgi:hypothetical protein
MKFFSVRWVENQEVAARAISIMKNIQTYVEKVEDVKEEQQRSRPKPPITMSIPLSASYEVVKNGLNDKLLLATLTFFESVAADVEPFLTKFQSTAPLAPFLYTTLKSLLFDFQARFVKAEVLEGQSPEKVDISNKAHLKRIEDIDLGFATKAALQKCNSKQKITDKMMIDFRSSCLIFLKKFVEKMVELSPLKYSFARSITCLDPLICVNEKLMTLRTKAALEKLVDLRRISGSTADKISREFHSLVGFPHVKEACASFDMSKTRIDRFWMDMIGGRRGFDNLKFFIRLVCILFHGNADLERGFSVNRECLVDNLKEESLVALRTIYDAVLAQGGIEEVTIDKSLILAARNASSLRREALAQKKAVNEKKALDLKRKRESQALIKQLTAKKLQLREEAEREIASIDTTLSSLKDT